jgi:hypothetical protein
MYNTDVEFQIIFSLSYGLLFGGVSTQIFSTILLCIIFEFYVFHVSKFYPPSIKLEDRILLNIIFILGWVIGKILIQNKTGMEDVFEFINY